MKRRFNWFQRGLMGVVMLLLSASIAFAQNVTVKGTVKSAEDGMPIPGVSVVEKGTTNGTITDIDGNYSISAPTGAVVSFSFVGMKAQEFTVGNQTTINVTLQPESIEMEGVVVTALGIEKKERGLTYSTQQIKSEELTRAKDVNLINSLAGKSAGVVITKSSSGVGGSSKVNIRGNRSASGSNQPLYVIDGIPMYNSSSVQPSTSIGGNNDAGGRDGGDGIGNLNPDDIESINILKGASASALYGSQAANGVIVITTKKGTKGRAVVNFSSSVTFEDAVVLAEFQDKYGKKEGASTSYGLATKKGSHNPEDYFNTGVNTINSLSVSAGGENMQTYFSYANTTAKGIVPDNKLAKHNFNFRETANLFNDKLMLDASVNLINQKVENRPTPGGFYFNPLVGLYRFPRGEDISPYRDNYQVFSQDRNMNVQNWHTSVSPWEQNPWWLTHMVPSEDVRNRVISSLTARFKINDAFNIQARGSVDFTNDKYEQHIYATTASELTDNRSMDETNGRFILADNQVMMKYVDVLLNYNKTFDNEITLTASLGASLNDTQIQGTTLDSRPNALKYANIFNVGNMLNIGNVSETKGRTQNQSIFGTAQVGYKDLLFLDVTGRNDWSSALAYTNSMDKGFFYPSVGLTAILSEMVSLPDAINFGKVRASYSSVGNTIPAYLSYPTKIMGAGGSLIDPSEAAFEDLKPEISSSFEVGTEWRFIDNKVTVDFTYYKTETKNQFFRLPGLAGSGVAYRYVNAGKIENKGYEIVLGLHPINTGKFQWKNYFNFASNKNKVIELHDELEFFDFGAQSSNSYWMRMEEGGEFGDIYGRVFERDENGKVAISDEGMPIKTPDFEKVANANPDFSLGWNGQFSYSNLTLNFLIDGRFGGDVMSITQADMDQWGVSKTSGDERAQEFVEFEGTKFTNVEGFYNTVGGRDGISEYYIYDATNIRLRELSLSYSLPKSVLSSVKFIRDVNVSVVGRNLFFFMIDAPYDPDAVLSTGNDLQGVDVFGMPTTRSLGFNLKLTF